MPGLACFIAKVRRLLEPGVSSNNSTYVLFFSWEGIFTSSSVWVRIDCYNTVNVGCMALQKRYLVMIMLFQVPGRLYLYRYKVRKWTCIHVKETVHRWNIAWFSVTSFSAEHTSVISGHFFSSLSLYYWYISKKYIIICSRKGNYNKCTQGDFWK